MRKQRQETADRVDVMRKQKREMARRMGAMQRQEAARRVHGCDAEAEMRDDQESGGCDAEAKLRKVISL